MVNQACVKKPLVKPSCRPLYKLCKKLPLSRISAKHYKEHLNKAATMAWHDVLPDDVFYLIMQLTERHPYYVNALCDEIWSECDACPDIKKINECWAIIVEGERSDLIKDFLRLSDNQRKVLIHIANQGGKELFSSHSSKEMDIAPGSLHSAVASLLERNFIEHTGDSYELIVPIYRSLLVY